MKTGIRSLLTRFLPHFLLMICLLPTPWAFSADTSQNLLIHDEKPQFILDNESVLPRMVFHAETVSRINLYLSRPNQSPSPLTRRFFSRYPSPSADGRFIFFQDSENNPFENPSGAEFDQSQHALDPIYLFQVYKLDRSTKKVTRISDGSALDSYPVVAPKGNQVAFCSRSVEKDSKWWQIFVMDFSGANRRILDDSVLSNQLYPSWSPDAKKVVYVSSEMNFDHEKKVAIPITRLMIRDIEKKTTKPLPTMGVILSNPSWSPGGDQISFSVYDSETETSTIWVINTDGSNMHEVTDGPEDNGASWFPDGTRLVFDRARIKGDDKRVICMVDLKTGKITELLSAKNASLEHARIIP